MSIGQIWGLSLMNAEKRRRGTQTEEEKLRIETETKGLVETIPARIELAKAEGKSSIRLLTPLTENGFAGHGADKLDALYARRGENTLKRNDIDGRLLLIYNWCGQNDAECFMRLRRTVWSHEYDLYIRPRSE